MILSKRFIDQFLTKKNQSSGLKQGFTLIELLVVIIIISILSAVALPNLLSQVGKGRETEATTFLGSINRSQQTYRFENGSFADDVDALDVSLISKDYSYSVDEINGSRSVTHQAVAEQSYEDDVRNYASGVYYFPNETELLTIICEGNTTTDDAKASIDVNIADCEGNSTRIQ